MNDGVCDAIDLPPRRHDKEKIVITHVNSPNLRDEVPRAQSENRVNGTVP